MIYIIVTEDQSAIKIGSTKSKRKDSVYERLDALQCGNHQKLSVLHSFQGNTSHESFLHGFLERYRLNREWFDYRNEELRMFIDRLVMGGIPYAVELFVPAYKFDPMEAIYNRQRIKYKTRAYLKKKALKKSLEIS